MAEEIRFLGDLQRLQMQPGDLFVMTSDRPITNETARRLQEAWASVFGDEAERYKLIVLGDGLKVGLISAPVED